MLKLDLPRIFAVRGVRNPFKVLRGLGISHSTAYNLLSGRVVSVKHRHLEAICEYLRCTPNDLYAWTPEGGASAAEGHPLRGLIREGDAAEIARAFAEIPLDKINEARDLLEGLKNND
ncbi:MAG: helix-turn-helix transcriptional regulator [Acidobacteria bacterium]|nr:helix-turn-helix transcriptional regulator [Acidobacteriota bacterium]